MIKPNKVIAIAFGIASLTQMTQAATLFESASTDATSVYAGVSIGGSSKQIYGAAFEAKQALEVSAIGGLFFSQGAPFPDDIFGAIIKLNSIDQVPTGTAFSDAAVLGYVTFNVGAATPHEVSVPLAVTLSPGFYAIVFGNGVYGTEGIATLPPNTQVYANNYLGYNTNSGTWYGGDGYGRVFVEGTVATVPEPNSLSLAVVGLLFISSLTALTTRSKLSLVDTRKICTPKPHSTSHQLNCNPNVENNYSRFTSHP